MDRRSFLGYRQAHTGPADSKRPTGNILLQYRSGTDHTGPHGRRRNRLGEGQEGPIRKNGARTENHNRRKQKLGFGTGGKGNGKKFSTDLQLLMTETTNDPSLPKTLVCLERQHHELIPEEYLAHKKKLSSRFGLVFIEDKIIVPKNLRTTIISLLHKGHPAINKMSLAARHFWWPRMTEAIQKKCETCIP